MFYIHVYVVCYSMYDNEKGAGKGQSNDKEFESLHVSLPVRSTRYASKP